VSFRDQFWRAGLAGGGPLSMREHSTCMTNSKRFMQSMETMCALVRHPGRMTVLAGAANMQSLGPNTVSIRDPTAMSIINSAGTTTTKGSFYDFALPKVLINTERDEKKHAQRRKTWESAFSMKALRSYEPIMNLHANKLSSTIEASVGEPVNISEYAASHEVLSTYLQCTEHSTNSRSA